MNMKKFFLLFLSSILIVSCSKSPEKLKSESDKLFNQAIDYYDRGYLNQAAELFEKVVEIETTLGGIQRRANSCVYLGLINYQLSDFYQSMDFYKKALKDFQSQNDKRSELLVLNNIAGIHSLLGEYEEAIKIYSDVIGKSLIFADKESEAIASLNLGDVYQEIWDFEKAFDYFNKAYDSYEVIGDVKGKIFTLNKIGELFIASKNFPNAIKSFDMAFEIINRNGINYLNQEIYNNIGLIYFYQNQISKAKEFFEASWKLKTTSESNQLILIAIKNNLGDCEYQSSSYSKAIEHYKEALSLSEQSYLKFLSPILQLKIGKSYERLYFINHNENDKKLAERFYQFAVNRFEENRDDENLLKALTSFSSFYTRIGEKKKALKYYERIGDIDLNLNLKTDDHLKVFALKPDFDFNFLQTLIEEQKFNEAYGLIHFQKTKNFLEYFLRFRDFSFLNTDRKEILQNLKREILALNTYQNILRQELSLPSSQRIKEKYKIASKFCDEKSAKVKKYLESLSEKYSFLKPLVKRTDLVDLLSDDSKIFVEFYPAEENLFYFIIGRKGIFARTLKSDIVSLKFNSNILLKNFDQFSYDDIVNFTRDNLSWIIDDLYKEIEQKYPSAKEITFLINGSDLDFVTYLIFSKKLNGFLRNKYSVSFSFILNKISTEGQIKNFSVLKNAQLNDLRNLKSQHEQLVSKEKSTIKKPDIRIGLRDETKSEKVEGTIVNKNFDAIFISDELIMNEETPELIYFQSSGDKSTSSTKVVERFYLTDLLRTNPKFVILKNFNIEDRLAYLRFLSLFELVQPVRFIFPITKKGQEISQNFLYNYKERVENKNQSEASLIFLKMIEENQKENLKSSLVWISFTN